MIATLASGPTSGSLALNPDGGFSFTPASGFVGAATFTYRAVNFAGASAPATVTITVMSPVGPPTDLIVTSVRQQHGDGHVAGAGRGARTDRVRARRRRHAWRACLASLPTDSTATTYTFAAPTGAFFIRMHSLASGIRSAASNEVDLFVNVPAPPSAPANLLGAGQRQHAGTGVDEHRRRRCADRNHR